jgi:conjugal transfer pilus assembly protein TraB
LKEGARVEELSRTIEALQRQLKQFEDERAKDQRREARAPSEGGGRQRPRADGTSTPPVPPLDQILPPPDKKPAEPRLPARRPAGDPKVSRPNTDPEATLKSPQATPAPPFARPAPESRAGDRPGVPTDSGKLRVITPRTPPGRDGRAPQADTVGWLPSGAIIPARLLSGVDAGTGTGTSLPYPVLLLLTDSAILPNTFRMDLEACFAIGSAWGDLPSERVYIRTETLSCLRRGGALITIDADLKGHVIGEDGKIGLRGRVVTKEGALIARSMIAGFLGGLSDAFKPRISYAPIQLGGTDVTQNHAFSLPPLTDTLAAAGLSGVGKSMEILARHYAEQATKIYPVIEIDAARAVDIVVLKGVALKFRAARPTEAPDIEVIE